MYRLAICFIFLHQAISTPQYYVNPEESFYSPWNNHPATFNQRPLPPTSFPSLNPYASPYNPQTQILLLDSKILALYDIIKCMELEGDIRKCSELIAKCEKLFKKKKKPSKTEDDDDDDVEDEDEEERKKKEKKKRRKNKKEDKNKENENNGNEDEDYDQN